MTYLPFWCGDARFIWSPYSIFGKKNPNILTVCQILNGWHICYSDVSMHGSFGLLIPRIQIQIQIQVWIQIQIQIQLREVSGVRIESLCICFVKINSTQVHMQIQIQKRIQTKITNTNTSRNCYSYDCIAGCPPATV